MGTPIEDGSVQGGSDSTPGQNPAWNDVLSVIPEQFHSQVTPHFQQWDQSAQSQIEKANSRVKEFEPYSQFAEHGIDPSELEQGLRLMYEINQNPKAVYDALAEAYNLTPGQIQEAIEGDDDEEDDSSQNFQDPRVDQLQQGIDLIGNIVLQEQQAKITAQADAELDAELTQLRKDFGDFDEQYVLAQMANGRTGKQAVEAFQSLTQTILQSNPRPFAPRVMGNSAGGSGLPSQAIDPTKLSGKDTRALVAQMLAQAAQQNQ